MEFNMQMHYTTRSPASMLFGRLLLVLNVKKLYPPTKKTLESPHLHSCVVSLCPENRVELKLQSSSLVQNAAMNLTNYVQSPFKVLSCGKTPLELFIGDTLWHINAKGHAFSSGPHCCEEFRPLKMEKKSFLILNTMSQLLTFKTAAVSPPPSPPYMQHRHEGWKEFTTSIPISLCKSFLTSQVS